MINLVSNRELVEQIRIVVFQARHLETFQGFSHATRNLAALECNLLYSNNFI